MDWPHDPDGEEGSEGGRKYGMAIIAKKVEDEDFPIEFSRFGQEINDHPVRINHDTVVPAGRIIDEVSKARAENKTEFNQAVGQAMREGGFWHYYPEQADI
ncbi:MAG: DUF5785 family protein [Halobacteriales archaeon]